MNQGLKKKKDTTAQHKQKKTLTMYYLPKLIVIYQKTIKSENKNLNLEKIISYI